MSRWKALLLVILSAGAALGASKASAPRPAPAFTVMDLAGKTWTQASENSLLLLDFWAGWCAPCVKEIPALNALQQKYAAGGKLKVLGLSLDKTPAKMEAAAAKYKILYPVAWVDPKLATAYGVNGFPTAFLIKDGQIIATLTGERKLAAFERDLAPFLK